MKKLLVVPASVVTSALAIVPAFASESASPGVTEMLTTGFTAIQADMLGTINAVVPIAFVVVGAVMAVRFGIKFFRGLAK